MAKYEKAGESDEWYTPSYVFDALGVRFDLDVASPPEGPRYVPAQRWFSNFSLERDWHGFVWMNPPFGHQSTKRKWLRKFFDHGNGIALLPDRTSAPWWQEFCHMANGILFVSPKVKFERPDGSVGEQPGTGTTLFAAGEQALDALLRAEQLGKTFQPIAAVREHSIRDPGNQPHVTK
ncbi:DNA N-6-adenine-methyltransferase [Roseibium sp. RKSG952]|uniref:DNA N-6-adenine-methyltransferase n=1 Tax=Roseibium sp. RKSG952 TaxID=2529384 RepID=UPI0012BBDDEC|nr:DNA N-6-adenine-methyltransferase [Roseibium sp. RKSG952]MTH95925.1 adenine methyltransferase [Roseibium sp. RKSG952]